MDSLATKLTKLGLSSDKANDIVNQTNEDLKKFSKEDCWQRMTQRFLSSNNLSPYPFSVHELLYKTIYPDWDKLPAFAWIPSDTFIKTTNLAKWIQEKKFNNYQEFHQWSVSEYPSLWDNMVKLFNIKFDKPYQNIVDLKTGIECPSWFPGAKLNIANSCFQAKESDIAIIFQTEQGETTKISYGELDKFSNQVANSLFAYVKKGDPIAIIMPMTIEAVAIYLGIIKSGCVVVSIADSFAAEEIAARFRIANVKGIFTVEKIIRDGKILPLYEKVTHAVDFQKKHKISDNSIEDSPFTIVLPTNKILSENLRKKDISWEDFLNRNDQFTAIPSEPQDYINILFSSGTTGDPKAIPWTQTTPIKCASDAYFHHNIQAGDVFCWPSNLGWMMGPWLIFATLINKATMALYNGTPNGQNFGKFIQDAKVTLLGVVPTIVKTWRQSGCMEGLNWRAIKLFSSTGECSNIEDMLYLMFLAHYRPIIEYCGGTEIGGAYITSTVIHPSAPAACSSPAIGLDFAIIDENGNPTDNGEVALIPPSIGLSTELLNKDHHQVYYENMPKLSTKSNKTLLRRHGDQVERYSNGYYRLHGRMDDTMNLGGIKVSSTEIELILNRLPTIYETAAVAIEPKEGGPSQLVIYAVIKSQKSVETIETIKPTEIKKITEKILVEQLKAEMQNTIKQHLNPLFKIQDVIIIDALPRTASNKVMRRVLRDKYQQRDQKGVKS